MFEIIGMFILISGILYYEHNMVIRRIKKTNFLIEENESRIDKLAKFINLSNNHFDKKIDSLDNQINSIKDEREID